MEGFAAATGGETSVALACNGDNFVCRFVVGKPFGLCDAALEANYGPQVQEQGIGKPSNAPKFSC